MQPQRLLSLFIAAMLLSYLAPAQIVSQELTTRYANAVIRKVYEVSTRIRLSPERQQQFADFYVREDSIIVHAITNGASREKVTELLLASRQEHEKLFSPAEWRIYNMQAATAADKEFIDEKMKVMEAARPLAKKAKELLYKGFINRRRTGSTETPEREFLKVLQAVTKDTIYFAALYKDEINSRVQEYVLTYPNYKKYPKTIAKDIMQEIAPAIAERQRQWVLLEYAMPYNSIEKDKIRTAIGNRFNPVMRKAELKRGFNMTKSLFATAYLNKDQLRINEKQGDSLFCYMEKISIDSLKTKYIADSSLAAWRKFEKRTLIRIIGEQKYVGVLGIENLGQSIHLAKNQWQDIKKYQLDNGADSAQTIGVIAKYQLHMLVSKAMFADDPEKGETDMRYIKTNRPQILNALELAKANPNSRQALKRSFTW